MKTNKIWLFTIAYCLLPLTLAMCLSFFVRRQPDYGQPIENTQVWIYSGHPIKQEFIPQNNGLNVITVYLKNVSLRNKEPFLFELSDSSGLLRTIGINGSNIGDGDNVRFQFAPVVDSAGRQFTIILSSESEKEMAIGAGYSDQVRSIAFQTYYFPQSRLSGLQVNVMHFIGLLFRPKFVFTAFMSGLVAFLFTRKLFNISK